MTATPDSFPEQLLRHLEFLYPGGSDHAELSERICKIFDRKLANDPQRAANPWSQEDCLLITYADSILAQDEPPLKTLADFWDQHCKDRLSAIHILPFFPFSSDDGFAVEDYMKVREDLGDWDDVKRIAHSSRLMADLVINHISSRHYWFQEYQAGEPQREGFFIEATLDDDLTQVVRPRATPLLRATNTPGGVKQVWCTFGHDQIDLNFANPAVLLAMLEVIAEYIAQGAQILRLDAVGYLWKEAGTTCIHLPQTHEVVRMIRTICDHFAPGTVLITETNVPNHENLTYFGNRNEAHAIYNFSLAPLLVHALLTGTAEYLKRWMMSMPPAPDNCTYLNFTASHDGIGMRPAEGLLSDHEQFQLVETIRRHGGQFSTRRTADGSERIYEMNVSLFDAFKGTVDSEDDLQVQRFLASQTVALGIEGIPAIYIHSLLATPNATELLEKTQRARSINRYQWDRDELGNLLADSDSVQSIVLAELLRRVEVRSRQEAFHPNATQFTLQSRDEIFCFWRQSRDRSQSIFAIHNMTRQTQEMPLSELNLIVGDHWQDLITGQPITDELETITLEPYQSMWISNRDGQ